MSDFSFLVEFYMNPTLQSTRSFTCFMLSLLVLIQTVELLFLKKYWKDSCGIWTKKALLKDFKFQAFLLNESVFFVLLILRLFAAVLFLFEPHPFLCLFFILSQGVILLRWRGPFNGGSDYVTAILFLTVFCALNWSENIFIVKTSLAYLAIQTVLSYFIAGIVKLKNKEWRSGAVIPKFLSNKLYTPYPVLRWNGSPLLYQWMAFSVILFELSSIYVFFNPAFCLLFMALGCLFHLQNSYLFGLNRFFWAWMAAYPVLYYFSVTFNG